mmetsp:Transcript_28547/g.47337  ORF Transcript_28547/g.47337 Transcript_28547/m.47337 type:complete len:87 (+) Transcript_28547:252-512(+)
MPVGQVKVIGFALPSLLQQPHLLLQVALVDHLCPLVIPVEQIWSKPASVPSLLQQPQEQMPVSVHSHLSPKRMPDEQGLAGGGDGG